MTGSRSTFRRRGVLGGRIWGRRASACRGGGPSRWSILRRRSCGAGWSHGIGVAARLRAALLRAFGNQARNTSLSAGSSRRFGRSRRMGLADAGLVFGFVGNRRPWSPSLALDTSVDSVRLRLLGTDRMGSRSRLGGDGRRRAFRMGEAFGVGAARLSSWDALVGLGRGRVRLLGMDRMGSLRHVCDVGRRREFHMV